MRVKGPLGFWRVARTTVVDAERACLVTGTADVGRRTRGVVGWEIEPVVPVSSHVRFTAEVERASLPDRVLLACGGRWWLRRIVRAAVSRLGGVLAQRPR